MKIHPSRTVLCMLFAALAACGPRNADTQQSAAETAQGGLLTVGSITVTEEDLVRHLKDHHRGRLDEETRRKALDELAGRARLAQAALDADLQNDPMVRAEFARVLANRFKEKELSPKLREIAETPVPESRLRELYVAGKSRFRTHEKRQVAVLWLNPNGNPEREKQYIEKLTAAREWVFNDADLKDHPEQGFSVLGVDHSEHQASRYNSGIVGWMESAGGMDAWTKAVAEIAFSLSTPGSVSEVTSRPEGVFLVRLMDTRPAVVRPFEAVIDELTRSEKQRLRDEAESDFNAAIELKYPVLSLR